MSDERARWTEVERGFAEVLDLDREARAARLERIGRDDPALRREIERLLVALDASDDFLEVLDVGRATGLLRDAAPEEVGLRIGPYRVVRELGRGGMGTVYLAERADGEFEQSVALKLVRHGIDHALVRERFRHERQILARLEHPNVARLLDGGTDSLGRPYFAMEYVDGQPVTDSCRDRSLDLRGRLQLIIEIAEAVRHAHQNLVVHRDLKPSNILVTAAGRVKLLDFGIARLLEPGADTDPAATTRFGVAALTPEYASPEQIRGQVVTTATDVHALGMLLYELITDRHPFTGDDERPSRVEMERRILEVEPLRPSVRARAVGRRVPRELDWIILTALRKDPERRYSTVDAFLRDLRDHLAGLPIAAGPETLSYRAGRLLARHRRLVTVGVLALMAAVAAATFHTVRIGNERDRARAEAERAEEISHLLVSLFEASDPWSPGGGTALTADQLLERGRMRIETELASRPQLQARLFGVLGGIQRRLGGFDVAESLLTRSLRLYVVHEPGDRAASADARSALAQLYVDRGQYARARPLFERAIEDARAVRDRDDLHLASIRNSFGAMLYFAGEHTSAIEQLEEARRARTVRGAESELAYTLNDLGLAMIELGHYARAESLLTEALTLHVRHRGEDHPDVASTLNNIGLSFDYRELDDQAESWYLRALETYRRVLGPDHPQVAQIADNIGAMLSTHGQWERSEAMLREALRIRLAAFGEESVPVAETRSNLGHLALFQGRHDEAVTLIEAAVRGMERDTSSTMMLASAVFGLGRAYTALDRLPDAERCYRRAHAIWREALGEETLYVARTLVAIGLNLEQQRRLAAAESCLVAGERVQATLAVDDDERARLDEVRGHLERVRRRLDEDS